MSFSLILNDIYPRLKRTVCDHTAVSMKDVQEELGREEAEERQRGVISLHETTASVFITMGLDLEEQQ